MNRSRYAIGAVLSALILLFSHPASAAPGDPIPTFDLVDLQGKQHTYQQYEGRILLLFFLGHN